MPVATPRHQSTLQLLRWFEYEHLSPDLRVISGKVHDLAHELVGLLPDGPELNTALRKLLEAKDCAVRAAIDGAGQPSAAGGDAGPAPAPATSLGWLPSSVTGPSTTP